MDVSNKASEGGRSPRSGQRDRSACSLQAAPLAIDKGRRKRALIDASRLECGRVRQTHDLEGWPRGEGAKARPARVFM